MFSLFHSIVCVFTDKGFIHIPFKALEHILNCCFGVLVLCFSYVPFLLGYCSRVIVFWWKDIVVAINICAFIGEPNPDEVGGEAPASRLPPASE